MSLRTLLPVVVLSPLLALAADPTPAPAAPNAVQLEMQALHELMVTTLVGIETGDLSKVPTVIQKIHGAKEGTEKALQSGAWKPRAGTTVKDFVAQDEAFHGELVLLLKASRANDVVGATKQLGAVLNGCTACHVKFKLPPAAPAPKAK